MSSHWRDSFEDWVWANAAGTFGLQVTGLGLGFAVSLVLARQVGAETLGIYEYVLAVVSALGPLAVIGTDKLLRRDVASLTESEQWSTLHHLLGWTFGVVTGVSLTLTVGVAGLLYGPLRGLPGTTTWTMAIGLGLVPLIAWIRMGRGTLQGLRHAALSLMPETLIMPGLLLLGLILMGGPLERGLSAATAVGLRLGGATVGLVFIVGTVAYLWPSDRRIERCDEDGDDARAEHTDAWWSSATVFTLVAGAGALNARADTVLLGYFESSATVGMYAVASRAAGLVLLVFDAMNQTLSGEFSRLESTGQRERLRRTAHSAQWLVLAVATPIACLLIGMSDVYMGWFGSTFERASGTLVILGLGRLAATATGLGSYLLMMTGHERSVAVIEGLALVVNVLLNILLIPHYGVRGAAIATAVSFVSSGMLQARAVCRRLEFDPSIMGAIRSIAGRSKD